MKNSKTKILRECRKRINCYKTELLSTSCPAKKQLLERAMLHEIDCVLYYIDELNENVEDTIQIKNKRQSKEFTAEELAKFDGTSGKPAYVAVNGIVYDVSNEATWGGASHFGLLAGSDLSQQFNNCHKLEVVLSKLPKVGVLK
jgi:predicted heme/steroid binding protein